jgi:cell division protein FtsB
MALLQTATYPPATYSSWQASVWEREPAVAVPRPQRARKTKPVKQLKPLQLLQRGCLVGVGLLMLVQLLVSATGLAQQFVLLESTLPKAQALHQNALVKKTQLHHTMAYLNQKQGLEQMAREHLDYAAPSETLVRLF